ncbi:MAG: urease accessory protein UreF [Firmicutes bacterium]|jgi:urease accessory protein|uniref:Urease accessory protein UreF n=1 Tax=Sulfobacillus benefaciens TaxID=453960 RepID=A0A2T2X0J4_9FIRM|nr:urease accessory protein UreF [Bacillota bacterium]MCL5014963.1 urease accessory protein UreF [Bacillota bacterium]PSR28004.1 MAG: hypothetical protein C7B43_10630 [Sulfobacillus benefaciens]
MMTGIGKGGEIFQFMDGLFPSGAFTHSFGLETLVQEGWIHDEASSRQWIQAIIRYNWATSDALGAYLVWQASGRSDFWEQVVEIDGYLSASRPAEESRRGSLRIGRRILLTACDLFENPDLLKYREMIHLGSQLGNQAVVLAVIGVIREWGESVGMQGLAYVSLSGMIQALVRLVPLGQREAQKLLFDLHPYVLEVLADIRDLTLVDIGSCLPFYDVATMRHRDLYSRLFRS